MPERGGDLPSRILQSKLGGKREKKRKRGGKEEMKGENKTRRGFGRSYPATMFIQMSLSSPCKGLKEDGKGTNFRLSDLNQKRIQYDTGSSNIVDVGKSPVSRLKRKDGKRFLVSCVGRSFRVFLG